MPSFFKKVLYPSAGGGQKNPYANPQHPNNPTNALALPSTTSSSSPFRSRSQPAPQQPASPRGSVDYLAEARQALGRDPVTGKKTPAQSQPARSGTTTTTGPSASATARGRGEASDPSGAQRGRSANGTRYDDFVKEMKARSGDGWAQPTGGFYAPERRLDEYYAPPGEFYAPNAATFHAAQGQGEESVAWHRRARRVLGRSP